MGVTAIIQMLDGLKDEDGQERIAFKGGAALELRFGFRARASNDLDGAYRGEVSEAIGLIDEGVRRGWSGFTGRTTEGEPIMGTGLAVAPVRFRVKLLYKEKDFVTVPMELSPVEGHSLDRLEVLPAAVSLAPVQLAKAEAIPFLPIRYQVAQKLHACTEDSGEERPISRNARGPVTRWSMSGPLTPTEPSATQAMTVLKPVKARHRSPLARWPLATRPTTRPLRRRVGVGQCSVRGHDQTPGALVLLGSDLADLHRRDTTLVAPVRLPLVLHDRVAGGTSEALRAPGCLVRRRCWCRRTRRIGQKGRNL